MPQWMGEMIKYSRLKDKDVELMKGNRGLGHWFAAENMAWHLFPHCRVGLSLLAAPRGWSSNQIDSHLLLRTNLRCFLILWPQLFKSTGQVG
jgi:hypothetical protein